MRAVSILTCSFAAQKLPSVFPISIPQWVRTSWASIAFIRTRGKFRMRVTKSHIRESAYRCRASDTFHLRLGTDRTERAGVSDRPVRAGADIVVSHLSVLSWQSLYYMCCISYPNYPSPSLFCCLYYRVASAAAFEAKCSFFHNTIGCFCKVVKSYKPHINQNWFHRVESDFVFVLCEPIAYLIKSYRDNLNE